MARQRHAGEESPDYGFQDPLPGINMAEQQAPQAPAVGTDDPYSGGGRSGETPRERAGAGAPPPQPNMDVALRSPGGGSNATPSRPSSPTPGAGSSFMAPAGGGSTEGVMPFSPMSQPSIGSMATPRLRGLFGSSGGLTGGGLGVPLDPVSNSASDPISSLIKALMGGQ